jgi:CysZ protein
MFKGIVYNFKGLKLGLTTPKLLFLGLIRFAVIVILTAICTALVLTNYQDILSIMWTRPESAWLTWLWYLASWFLALLLVVLSAVFSFLLSQLLFSVVVMDVMSRITERLVAGEEKVPVNMPLFPYFVYLIRQEIPRAILPVMVILVLMVLGWLTPFSPILTLVAPVLAGAFLAWDNTDLIPARRLEPFGKRFRFLLKNVPFHIGFGLPFLVPGANILFLSFAPVGAALYYFDRIDGEGESGGSDSEGQSPKVS